MGFNGERQKYTGYRVTSKINGSTYELGLGEKTSDTAVRYAVKIKSRSGKPIKFHLGETYIRESIKRPIEQE
jgi:hypothetical protein